MSALSIAEGFILEEVFMKYKKFGEYYVIRFDRGEELVKGLLDFSEKEGVRLGIVSGIGAADFMDVGLYSVEEKEYHSVELRGEMEITALNGNITEMEGKPYLHLHVSAGNSKMQVQGGHLRALRISGTGEVFVTVIEGTVGRKKDEKGTGLNVFSL